MSSLTADIARDACTLAPGDIPPEARRVARHCMLDLLGVTLAGADDPVTRILRAEAEEEQARPASTVIGTPLRTSVLQAAVINGTASHALDYDDVSLALNGHPTAAILPALLAQAEATGATGEAVMTAFVAGYEAACRIGTLMQPDHYRRGFHNTATIGALGAAIACSRLLGSDTATTQRAIGIAGTLAAGLKHSFGTMCKPLHAGWANRTGLMAARYAMQGMSAREDMLDAAGGFAHVLSRDHNVEGARAEPPGGWHILSNLFKYHAACYNTHAAIDAAREIACQPDFGPDAISSVTVRVNPVLDTVCNIRQPSTGLETKFSLTHTVALALCGIDTASIATFSDANAVRPDLVAMRDRVSVEWIDAPDTFARVIVKRRDGERFEATGDSSVASADLDEQEERLAAKFTALVGPILGNERTDRLIDTVSRFELLDDIAPLLAYQCG
ncbi:MmgE/PrpD family protein [Croceicoccus sediminis]|uniref:MmgE/PrpD family protein n=1 Tax=Croceicoccus sediminis TaxID=2571150 RepID=UPI0011825415|nr:MmgE/PrpD family protein [Croceicoccus sediminis]